MDNRLREAAVKVAVWASTQHTIGEVWFAGSRVTGGPGNSSSLEIIVVMLDHAQQVQVRKSGRQTSAAGWENDLNGAVRERLTLQTVNAPAPEMVRDAVRIFARGEAPAGEIRCSPIRSDPLAADAGKTPTDVRGGHADVRTL